MEKRSARRIISHTFENVLQVGHRNLEELCISYYGDSITTPSAGGLAKKAVRDGRDGRFSSVTRDQVECERFGRMTVHPYILRFSCRMTSFNICCTHGDAGFEGGYGSTFSVYLPHPRRELS